MTARVALTGIGLTVRTLPPEERHKISQANGPMHDYPTGQLPENARIVVLEKEDTIVGYWVIFDAVHIEPLHLDPEVRNMPKAAMGLLAQVYTELQDAGVRSVFGIIDDADVPIVGAMAEQLGLKPLPGKIYGGFVPPKE